MLLFRCLLEQEDLVYYICASYNVNPSFFSLLCQETKFEYEVQQNVLEERQNKLRWYVNIY